MATRIRANPNELRDLGARIDRVRTALEGHRSDIGPSPSIHSRAVNEALADFTRDWSHRRQSLLDELHRAGAHLREGADTVERVDSDLSSWIQTVLERFRQHREGGVHDPFRAPRAGALPATSPGASGTMPGRGPGQLGSTSGSLPPTGGVDAYLLRRRELGIHPSTDGWCTGWALFRWRELGFTGDFATRSGRTGNGVDMAGWNGGSINAPPTLGAMVSTSGVSAEGHVMIIEAIRTDAKGATVVKVSEMNVVGHGVLSTDREWRLLDDGWYQQVGSNVRRQFTIAAHPGAR